MKGTKGLEGLLNRGADPVKRKGVCFHTRSQYAFFSHLIFGNRERRVFNVWAARSVWSGVCDPEDLSSPSLSSCLPLCPPLFFFIGIQYLNSNLLS